MKKIFFLTSQLSDKTGGAIYDSYFYNKLFGFFGSVVEVVQDSDFKYSNKGINFLTFCFLYLANFRKITDGDILILNSRLYTRFIFIMLFNKLKKKNCKIVMIHHHYNYMTHKGLANHIHKFLEIGLLKNADQIIIPNPYVVDLTKKIQDIKGEVVFLNSSFQEKNYLISQNNNNRVLFVGTIEKRKGLLYGLKAFNLFLEENPEFTLTIVGNYSEGSRYYKKLARYIDSVGLNDKITFTGRVNNDELEWYYCNSDFFLFPSLNEGFGWVMIEAMAHGLPVVAFNNTAMPYTVKDNENGFLATNCNIEDLATCMNKIVSDRNKLDLLKKGAIQTYTKSSKIEVLDEKIEQYFKNLFKD